MLSYQIVYHAVLSNSLSHYFIKHFIMLSYQIVYHAILSNSLSCFLIKNFITQRGIRAGNQKFHMIVAKNFVLWYQTICIMRSLLRYQLISLLRCQLISLLRCQLIVYNGLIMISHKTIIVSKTIFLYYQKQPYQSISVKISNIVIV